MVGDGQLGAAGTKLLGLLWHVEWRSCPGKCQTALSLESVLSVYIAYMADTNLTCLHYIIDMNYEQNAVVLHIRGAFCPVRSGTPQVYNILIIQYGC